MNAPTPILEPTPGQPNRRVRRATAIGLTAGLLGGGAAGLLFAVPSLTSATTDTVTLQDTDTSDTSDTGDTTADDTARPARGERVRETLQALVDDGTITAEQADAVAAHLAANMPAPGGRGGRGFDGTVIADALGITADELRTALQDGQSIADVAAAEGVDVQVVIDALVAEAEARLAQAVNDGRITQDVADDKLSELTDRITERVDQAGGFGRGGFGRGHMHGADEVPAAIDDSALADT